jgi:hypothetical protein
VRTDILYDQGSTDAHSKAFIIAPGTFGVLSVWGMQKYVQVLSNAESQTTIAQMAIVEKLAFAGGEFPNVTACQLGGMPALIDPKYSYAEDVTQCGLWHLSACQNLVAMSVPGTYRIRLNDPGAVGQVFMTLTRYTQDEAGYISRNVFLGVT